MLGCERSPWRSCAPPVSARGNAHVSAGRTRDVVAAVQRLGCVQLDSISRSSAAPLACSPLGWYRGGRCRGCSDGSGSSSTGRTRPASYDRGYPWHRWRMREFRGNAWRTGSGGERRLVERVLEESGTRPAGIPGLRRCRAGGPGGGCGMEAGQAGARGTLRHGELAMRPGRVQRIYASRSR